MGSDRRVLVDRQEVRVQRLAGERVVMDGLQEGHAGAGTFDVEVDQNVFRTASGEHLGEGLGMHLEVLVWGAAPVHDRRQPAFAAHLIESAGAGAVAHGCLECLLSGHIREGVWGW